MTDKDFTFTEESFSKEEIELLRMYNIHLNKDDVEGDVYFSTYIPSISYSSLHCWNINVMRDVIKYLQNTTEWTQREFYEVYGRKMTLEVYEYDYSSVRFHYTHRKTGKPTYARQSFSEISEREIVAENDECYTRFYIGTGEMADGRTDIQYLFKTKQKCREMALKALDDQIESAIAYKKLIEEEDN
jgi:hypothetical protein